ncbi:MAG: preprotein translocase subunit SecA [Lentimicrobiaceae bacterium]|jgi:preprotein translocase subunit SecA|nr:preprotein translocase subunit SecA [Lentimicrobiaceae bacterium]MDD4598179.1 preprotein translocase subunit SecA [Lentimicrobiaceae bacterium]MDY0026077.1 preprotein translocase subunit SecA [Lentimicrobium sp.]
MLSIIKKFLGTKSEKDIKALNPILEKIKAVYPEIEKLDNDALRARTLNFKQRIAEAVAEKQQAILDLKASIEDDQQLDMDEKEKVYQSIDQLDNESYQIVQEVLNDLLPEAFAVMKETARRFKENETIEVTATDFDRNLAATRAHVDIIGDKAYFHNKWVAGGSTITWDMVHYDVQLIGGIVLHQGKIAEMATGEGKTLVATLPVYLNALHGKGVHMVTVNDYLARRDSEWMGVLYEFHGLSVDTIDKHEPNSEARRKAYLADITFGTNNEFGFDYLRDNMTRNPEEMVQRPHNYAIVDEVDSVLIDDARTPLIISGPTPRGDNQEFEQLKPEIRKLYEVQRNLVTKLLAEAKSLLAEPSNAENEKRGGEQLFRAYRGLPKNKALIKFLSEPGMRALMQKTENFYMAEQSKHMHIIDDELYFVIDEKNNTVELTEKGIDLITTSYDDPKFYILPDIGAEIAELEKAGLSETDKLEKKSELMRDYSIKSERVHTVNQLLKAYTLFEKDVEYVVMDNKIKIVDEQTGRILEGRRYSDGLHQAIEAKENVKIEAATQTYATVTLQNYFRMYRKLAGMTGTAETEAGELWDIYKLDVVVIPTNRPIVRDDREDLVYKTKREKFNAVADEIMDLIQKGRPVLVGTTSVETSELLSRMLKLRNIKHNVLNAKLHQREADIVAEAGQAGTVTIATNMAGRGTDIKLGAGVKQAGGLAIIGTERHESRRVDRQLRGRSGRQGDPGSSQFFVSLEDDLMRMFGSERIAKIMDRLGLKEGEVIQHSMITKSIERAQRKVEENNFGIRKRLLEYDDVMNSQREVIYKKRRHALYGERLAVDISNMIYDVVENIIATHQEDRDFEAYRMAMLTTLAADAYVTESEFIQKNKDELTEEVYEKVYKNYRLKCEHLAQRAYPVIKEVYENQSRYENIAIPITDGKNAMQVVANLKKAYNDKGREITLAIEKGVTLGVIDDAWKDHLREMDELRSSVQNATYEQKDPLLIYKFESFELFKILLQKINRDITAFITKANLPVQEPSQVKEAQAPKRTDTSKLKEERSDLLSRANPTSERQVTSPIRVEKKVGRNDPCPCGSGKKYKNCHGREE